MYGFWHRAVILDRRPLPLSKRSLSLIFADTFSPSPLQVDGGLWFNAPRGRPLQRSGHHEEFVGERAASDPARLGQLSAGVSHLSLGLTERVVVPTGSVTLPATHLTLAMTSERFWFPKDLVMLHRKPIIYPCSVYLQGGGTYFLSKMWPRLSQRQVVGFLQNFRIR